MANQQRRDQITDAALQLFDELGYHGTSMGDIAKSVGMSASSLYNHFGSKQEVLAEIMRTGMERLLRTHAAALAGIDEPVEQLRASMATHVEFHARNNRAVRVTNNEILSLEEPTRSVVKQLRRDYVARWVDIVDRGMRQGVFTVADEKITCYGLIDMGMGVSLWYRDDANYSPQELGLLYAQAALRQCGYYED